MELTLSQYIILGLIQGITEWLPISSSGMITLVVSNFFNITNISEILQIALFFHLGTFFSALIYFRKEVADLFVALFNYKKTNLETKKVLKFLIITTLLSGFLGFLFIFLTTNQFELTGRAITFFVAIMLFITAGLQLGIKNGGFRKFINLNSGDGIILGLVQGIATLPGISRSGITVSTLLLNKFEDTTALKLSFLMSLPIIFFGNILINASTIAQTFSMLSIIGLLTSFIFGLLTIHALIKLSKRINFGWFVLIFAILMMLSVLI